MSTDTLELVNLDELLNDAVECWRGHQGATLVIGLTCCPDIITFGCAEHYHLWLDYWQEKLSRWGYVECKHCDTRFTSITDGHWTQPI